MNNEREVHDTMGTMKVPADAYYGAQTARAVINFPLTGMRAHPEFIRALAGIKLAAARVHRELGLLAEDAALAIEQAAREVFEGNLRDQFPVDVLNAGAGTSMHMNANEVIAARAAEILCGDRNRTDLVHPNDHVNLGQSTNDVIPTAIRIAGLVLLDRLVADAETLAGSFHAKAVEFDPIVKSGRTHLQDAVPVRLGQEFEAYGLCVERWTERLRERSDVLCELGIGGSAAGTGINTHPEFRTKVVRELSTLYGHPFRPAENLFLAMQSQAPVVEVLAAARGLSLDLIRITNDLRLLSSGPRTGLAEIQLPPVQPGSSIMPGKVNPVIAESTAMACFQVIGCEATVAVASQAGQCELNVMMPVIAWNFLFALDLLGRAARNLASRCVAGITADVERCRSYAENTLSLATLLNPVLGYERVAALVKEAVSTGKSIRTVLLESGQLPPEQVEELFDLRRWTEPGFVSRAAGQR